MTERVVKLPVGTWPKDKRLKSWGGWFQYFWLEGLEGFTLRSFTDVLGVRAALASLPIKYHSRAAMLTRLTFWPIVVLRGGPGLSCPNEKGAREPKDSYVQRVVRAFSRLVLPPRFLTLLMNIMHHVQADHLWPKASPVAGLLSIVTRCSVLLKKKKKKKEKP